MLTFELIEQPDEIKKYYPQWEQMFLRGKHEASLSLDWTNALLSTHLGKDKFFLAVIKNSFEALCLVPLCIKITKKASTSILTMTPVSEYFGTHSDILIKDNSEETVNVLINSILSLGYKWDIFRMNRFIETNPILSQLEHNLSKNISYKYSVQRAEPSFYIELEDTYDKFLQNKSANFRYNLKRVAKKINTLGKVKFIGNQDFHDFHQLYDIILNIEEKSWKHKHGTAITSSEKQRQFYRELGKSAFAKGWFRSCILYIDNDPVAFEMGLVKGKKYYGVHGSFIEKYKKENPGTMLLAKFIEDLIQDGIEEYDWFGEPFEWQSRWTDKYRWHKSLLIYNHTPKARLFYIFNTIKNIIQPPIGEQVLLRNPRDIRPG